MITFLIDSFTPCLEEVSTGKLYMTEVVRVKSKNLLSQCNSRNGWYINWSKFPEDTEVYALVLKGTMDIQGMVSIRYDDDAKAVYMVWACVAPENNVWEYGTRRFLGVGGHLFAIASDLSMKAGYDGFVVAEAMDQQLYDYYISEFGALPLPPLDNPFRFMLSEASTKKIREVYDFEWTDKVL